MAKTIGLCKATWRFLKRQLQSLALGIAGRPIKIADIPSTDNSLAYTADGDMIYIAPNHPIMDGLKVHEVIMFIKGLFSHELMHQLITDFKEMVRICLSLPKNEAEIFRTIFNVMEDPAIEFQSIHYIGGHLRRALSFTVMTCYRKSPELTASKPFVQFINALIHYGDGGLVKGVFTSELAKEYFYRVLPIFDKAIEEPNPTKRVAYAKEVFDITRPLWEPELKLEEMLQELMKELASSGKSTQSSSSAPMDPPSDPEEEGSSEMSDGGSEESSSESKSMSRKKARRALTRKEAEEGKEGSESTSSFAPSDSSESENETENGSGSGSTESSSSDISGDLEESAGSGTSSPKEGEESESTPGNSSSASTPSSSENEETSSESSGTTEKASNPNAASASSNEESPAPADTAEENNTSDSSASSSEETSPSGMSSPSSRAKKSNEVGTIDEEEFEMDASDIEQIKEELADCENEIASEKALVAEASDVPDIEELKTIYPNVTCLNKVVKMTSPDSYAPLYESILAKMSGSINFLVNQLQRVIRNTQDDREYRNSGRVSIKRLSSGVMTPKVFTRNKAPSNRSDTAVVIMIDESGSMHGYKAICARDCAIGLAEVFGKLGIPTKIIGFTADEGKYDAIQFHYLNWLNTPSERLKLLNISARSNNFDGYSIRYCTKLLQKRKEEHKLLIVVSDGQPACTYYSSRSAGIIDTKDAVNTASKKVSVLGVAIGNDATDTLFSIYRNYFLHCANVEEMFHAIGSKLIQIIKKW